MQEIIIDLPRLGEQVRLPSDQWNVIRKWLEEQPIAYSQRDPEAAPVKTTDQSVTVFEIRENEEAVSSYLKNHDDSGNR